MKKPIHLYIFVVLSAIASIWRVFKTFFASFNEAEVRQIFEGMDELILVLEESYRFQVNLINKGFAIVLLALLITTIVFLFRKKNEHASYTYIAYLFGTLLFSTYSFIGAKGMARLYTDEFMRQGAEQTTLVFYIVNIVLFAIYFGVTIFFLLRKPKNNPSMEQTATDI